MRIIGFPYYLIPVLLGPRIVGFLYWSHSRRSARPASGTPPNPQYQDLDQKLHIYLKTYDLLYGFLAPLFGGRQARSGGCARLVL